MGRGSPPGVPHRQYGRSYGGFASDGRAQLMRKCWGSGWVDWCGRPSERARLRAPVLEADARNAAHARRVNSTADRKRLLAERSPLSRVDRIVRPLLIGQDSQRPARQAGGVRPDRCRHAEAAYGHLLLYPDEGPRFRAPEDTCPSLAVAEPFLARCLGGRTRAVGDDFDGLVNPDEGGRGEGPDCTSSPWSVRTSARVDRGRGDICDPARHRRSCRRPDVHLHSEAGPRLEQVIRGVVRSSGDRLTPPA